MSSSLRKCPFCGGEACAKTSEADTVVCCTNPQCKVALRAKNRDEAIRKWNFRPFQSETASSPLFRKEDF